jgi:hypothetical protein
MTDMVEFRAGAQYTTRRGFLAVITEINPHGRMRGYIVYPAGFVTTTGFPPKRDSKNVHWNHDGRRYIVENSPDDLISKVTA